MGDSRRDMSVSAVFALLVGMAAALETPADSPLDTPLAPAVDTPVFNGAPGDRRGDKGGPRGGADDETVGAMPPTMGFTIERRIIIRIPTLRSAPPPPETRAFQPQAVAPPQLAARQRSTCLSMRNIRGATVQDRAGILLVTNGDERYQAVLERGCRPVDFQSGFYLGATDDGSICAGRDTLHARSGLRCTIVALNRLSPGM